jgi:hypothetical protein
MKKEDLIQHYPRLYHMAESGTWPSIRRHGLMSTTALLDLFEVKGEQRRIIEDERRPECVEITHPKHGKAVIRDQKPLRESALLKCLQKPFKPRDWYRILNANVFFWVDARRLDGLLGARAYRDKYHCVLTLDSRALITSHAHAVQLSPMNSGSTIHRPLPRGATTFLPIEGFPFEERRATRAIQNTVVELLVRYSVPNIGQFILKVEERRGADVLKTLWERE